MAYKNPTNDTQPLPSDRPRLVDAEEPYRVEGKKTMGYELWKLLDQPFA
jgi:hypothetical protein